MSKPFDVAAKRLVEADPLAWLAYAGLPGTQAELVDAELSVVSSEADRIVHVHTPEYMAHIELQSTYEEDIDVRMLRYNTLVFCKYRMPVQSVIFLLRKQADGEALSGTVGYEVPESPDGSLWLRYRIVRVWERSPEEVLNGPLATLPLAPLAKVTRKELPGVVRHMEARLSAEAPPEERKLLWTTIFLLLGLKYQAAFARQLLKGVMEMKESTTYQDILNEGREEGREAGIREGKEVGELDEARRILLRLGSRRFGAPDPKIEAAIEAITSRERLEQLIDRVPDVENWADLMA